MILPNYEVIIKDTKSEAIREIIFDKVRVKICGDAKYSRTEITYFLKQERKEDFNLSTYIKAINDYLISNPTYKSYNKRITNVFDFKCVKFLNFDNLIFTSDEFQIINNNYPNIISVLTRNCIVSEKALIGCLKCNYYCYTTVITSLDSLNGFSGNVLSLYDVDIKNKNKNTLNLLCSVLKLKNTNIDYGCFFLTTNAPKMRKLEIENENTKKVLNNHDLLFISGFFNLESIHIDGIVENYDQIRKLERLRELIGILIFSEDELNNYLMYQELMLVRKHLDFYHKLYVPRLDRVKFEDKLLANNIEKIKEELINISNMSLTERKNILREKTEYTLFDELHGLCFDKCENEEEEDILIDSRPFQDGGIQYYIRRKKIIYDKY